MIVSSQNVTDSWYSKRLLTKQASFVISCIHTGSCGGLTAVSQQLVLDMFEVLIPETIYNLSNLLLCEHTDSTLSYVLTMSSSLSEHTSLYCVMA